MKENIWKRFGVRPLENRDEANLIGFDNGAGTSCACLGEMTIQGFNAKHLSFDQSHEINTLYSVFALSQEEDIVGDEAVRHEDSQGVCTNFKRPLNDLCEEICPTIPALTYKEVMKRFFQRAVCHIFENNADQLKGKERTVLFVGRPASQVWEECELEYQRLLKTGLQEMISSMKHYEGHQVDVIVYSEAQAALAYEYSQENIVSQEAVLILDCGSSTFDAVLVCDRKILAEYSRQIGAGMLDELMTDELLLGDSREDMEDVDVRLSMREKMRKELIAAAGWSELTLTARKLKELYYGPNGKGGMKGLFGCYTKSGEHERIVDEEFMEKVIYKIPIRIEDSYSDMDEIHPFYGCHEYPSFYEAVKAFMKECKERCEKADRLPDRVVLTGGASVMPFLGKLVREQFGDAVFGEDQEGIVVERSQNPAFSVGEGLAFMGYLETVRYENFYKYTERIDNWIDSSNHIIRHAIKNAYVDAAWNSLIQDLEEWCKSDRYGETLREGIQGNGFPLPVESIAEAIQKELLLFTQKMAEELSEEFRKLFGESLTLSYDYKVEKQSIQTILRFQKELNRAKFAKWTLFGLLRATFVDLDTPIDRQERQKQVERIKRRRKYVLRELEEQFWNKSNLVLRPITEEIRREMVDSLEQYLEECTPYFVEMAVGGN